LAQVCRYPASVAGHGRVILTANTAGVAIAGEVFAAVVADEVFILFVIAVSNNRE
jgi:hypothetical protein